MHNQQTPRKSVYHKFKTGPHLNTSCKEAGSNQQRFDSSHPAVLFNTHKVFYSVTTHQCLVNNTQFWLHVSVYQTIFMTMFIT